MDARTCQARQRRSGRLRRQLPIQISGIDAMGADFTAPARTLTLSRFGAEVLVSTELVPDQEISVGLMGRPRDWDARVVALYARRPDGFAYGIEFLYEAGNFWGIQFPPPPTMPRPSDGAKMPAEVPTARPAPVGKPGPSRGDVITRSLHREPGRTYAVRLKCPMVEAHGALPGRSNDDDDQWLVLPQRHESLQQVLESPWDFACPIHGAQREYPLEAREVDAAYQHRPNKNGLGSSGGLSELKLAESVKRGFKNRRESRRLEEIRVWVQGMDRNGNTFRQSAKSLDVSKSGARLEGLGLLTYPGSTIEVRRHWRKARFRVVWVGRRGTSQATQIGIKCLEPGKNVWNLPEGN